MGSTPEHTAARKQAYLSFAETSGTLNEACRRSHISRSTVHHWRQTDEDFEDALQKALDIAHEDLEAEARKRAVEGWHEPVIYQGAQMYARDPQTGDLLLDENFEPIPLSILKKSDRLLEVMLTARRPGFAKKVQAELSGPGGSAIPSELTVRFVGSDGEGRMDPLDE